MEGISAEKPNPRAEHATSPLCLEVRELHYSYASGTEALRGLSFSATAGRITALLGPNGSGKTTSFKILTTQLTPSQGEAFVFGRSLSEHRAEVRRMIGVTFQAPSLDPWLTVEENLRLQAKLYGLGGAALEARLNEVLEIFELTDRRRARVRELSGGLARRAELAKTLLPKPRLLFLDEPTTGLDPKARFAFWREIRRLRDAGLSIVVTTHLMEEADISDEILVLNKGRLVAQGAPEKLKGSFGAEVVLVEGENLDQPGELETIRARLGAQAQATLDDGRLRVETREPSVAFEVLRQFYGARIQSLQMGRATLADVYLKLTGEALS